MRLEGRAVHHERALSVGEAWRREPPRSRGPARRRASALIVRPARHGEDKETF